MTLVLKRDLDIVKMSLPKLKVPVSRYSRVVACTDRHTDIQTQAVSKRYLPTYAGRKNSIVYYTK